MAVAVLGVLVAGSIGTYAWALGHWFVGVDDSGGSERVAVFRGVDVSILGLDLFRVDETTDLAVSDLTPAARNRVRDGITSDGTAHTDRILDALRDQRLPPCRADGAPEENGATPTPGSSAGSTASGSTASGSTASGSTASGSPATGSATPASTPPSGTRSAPTTTAPQRTPSTPGTTTESRTTSSPEPGKDCREEK